MCALGCAMKEAGELRPTVAGILLFGKSMALRRMFPMTRVDYIRLPCREWVTDPTDRFQSIDMRAPLFKLIQRAQAAVLDDLPNRSSSPRATSSGRTSP